MNFKGDVVGLCHCSGKCGRVLTNYASQEDWWYKKRDLE